VTSHLSWSGLRFHKYLSRDLATCENRGDFPVARMMSGRVVCLLDDIGNVADVVGLGITEHLPWDAIAPKSLLAS